MAELTLTDDDRKELEQWLHDLDELTEQEPEDLVYSLPADEINQVERYFLDGEGDPPANAGRYAVREGVFLDRDGEKRIHKYVIDTVWEAWNQKCVDLNNQHHDVIMKALTVQLANADLSGNTGDVSEVVRAVLRTSEATKARDFDEVPTSPYTDLIMAALGAANDLQGFSKKQKAVSHSSQYEVTENQKTGQRRITKTNDSGTLTVELGQIEKFLGTNKAAKKLFVFATTKVNEQALFNGKLCRDYITFPLQELVDVGMYANVRSARAGFYKAAEQLALILVKGDGWGDMTATEGGKFRNLFGGADVNKGQCILYLNTRVNWNCLAQFYTILPRFYYKLSNRASDLLMFIFYMARQKQNYAKIKKDGSFTISFRAIQAHLDLPSEKGLNNPQRDIKQPIEDAITEIEDANHEQFHNADFTMLPVYDDRWPVSQFLDKGYLKITLQGKFAEPFLQVGEKRTKKIESKAKTSAKRKQKAIPVKSDTPKTTS